MMKLHFEAPDVQQLFLTADVLANSDPAPVATGENETPIIPVNPNP